MIYRKRSNRGLRKVVRIRPLDPKRLPAVMAIEKEAFPQDSYPVQLMREYLSAYPKGFLVAESNGQIVGYIIGSLVDGQARIVSMAVSRRWKRTYPGC